MKRKLPLIGTTIMVLLIAYSAVAWWMLRGAGAYRMGTQLGGILSASWQYTALAALLLAFILGIPFVFRRIRKSKAAELPNVQKKPHGGRKRGVAEAEGQTAMQTQQDTEKLQPRRGTRTSSGDETVLLSDDAASPDDKTELLSDDAVGPDDETVLLSDGTVGPNDKTVLLNDGVTAPLVGSDSIHDDTTVLLPEAVPATENDTVLLQSESVGSEKAQPNDTPPSDKSCCPKCGAPVRVGQKFCTRCGCVLRGGSV